jgi:DNA-binding response OmpR family regulator
MLSTFLEFSKIETQFANSAAQALSAIQAQRFDMYLLEAWLPEIDGFELCHRMRAADPDIPILFFSGAAYEADKGRGREAGANDYVLKPEIETLLESIAKYLPQAKAAARSKPQQQGLSRSHYLPESYKGLQFWTGDREVYQRYFPEAYEHGYADGFGRF